MSRIKFYESRRSNAFLWLGGLPLSFLSADFFTFSIFSDPVYIILLILCLLLICEGFLHKRKNFVLVTGEEIIYKSSSIRIDSVSRIEVVRESEIHTMIKISSTGEVLCLSGFKLEKLLSALFQMNYCIKPLQAKNV